MRQHFIVLLYGNLKIYHLECEFEKYNYAVFKLDPTYPQSFIKNKHIKIAQLFNKFMLGV